MNQPLPLTKGDTIAITCPSGYLEPDKCIAAHDTFVKWGYKVIIGNTVGNGTNYFAGSDQERREELQRFLDDDTIRCIFMGRGGYGMSRIIDDLNFNKFKKNPKWICGFSDITLLHLHIQMLGICSLHSAMCVAFRDAPETAPVISSIKKSLAGKPPNISYQTKFNQQQGTATGILLGGNLAMVTHAVGSKSMPDFKGAILLLEDIGEHLYKIDRMLLQLKRAGIFDKVSGMVFGQFTDVEDTTRPFGTDLNDLLLYHLRGYDIPVALDAPIGHVDDNRAMILGLNYYFNVQGSHTILSPITSNMV